MPSYSIEVRASLSRGTSGAAIYDLVSWQLESLPVGQWYDVGCGTGHWFECARKRGHEYTGIDVVRYPNYPSEAKFLGQDLNQPVWEMEAGRADLITCVEVIEHLENSRALFRNLSRLLKPGGVLLLTTPNNLSWLSKMTLVTKNNFNAFQDSNYPAHITALLEVDLRRLAEETGLSQTQIFYTGHGRWPGLAWSYPGWLSRLAPRAFSDNVMLVSRKTIL